MGSVLQLCFVADLHILAVVYILAHLLHKMSIFNNNYMPMGLGLGDLGVECLCWNLIKHKGEKKRLARFS
jgi:hypothetical protein